MKLNSYFCKYKKYNVVFGLKYLNRIFVYVIDYVNMVALKLIWKNTHN